MKAWRGTAAVAAVMTGAAVAGAATNAVISRVVTNAAVSGAVTNTVPSVGHAGMPATVERVDAAAHAVTVKSPDGRVRTVTAGPEAAGASALKSGDTVRLQRETYAVDIQKAVVVSGPRTVARPVAVAPPHQEPRPGDGALFTVQATIKAIDVSARTLTIAGMDGGADMAIRIGAEVRNASSFHAGDRVMIHYMERSTLAP